MAINPFQGPINYSVDVQSPFEAALSGFKIGAAGAEAQAKTQALEQSKKAQTELAALFNNKNATAADYERVTAFLPKDQAAIVTQGFERKTKLQQENDLKIGGQVYSAIKSGQPDIAKTLLQQQADAYRTGGKEQEAKATETYLQLIDMNPTGAQATVGLMMAALPGGKDLLENVDKTLSTGRLEALAPSALNRAVAEADEAVSKAQTALATAANAPEEALAKANLATANAKKAQLEAEFARKNLEADLLQKGATFRKTETDILINKENARIAALTAAAAKETNALKREELQQKINESKEKRDATDRDQLATFSSQSADIDNFLNTAARIKQTPKDIIKQATGPIASRLPTSNQDVADFESLVETLGSQAFISQIPKIKGTGALSENEGNKLQASLQNLSLKQSPERLIENVNEAVRLLEKQRAYLAVRSGQTGLPLDVPARVEVFVMLPDGNRAKFRNQAEADAFKKKAGMQ
jgi:hypothetical protein